MILLPTRAVKADRLVREYRDEVGREVGRLVKLAKNLRVPREKAIEILADVPYKLSVEEAEAMLRRLAGGNEKGESSRQEVRA